ncbi:MAG TPA: TIM-barrel domain-containing protein, partial [Flavisolibacter sp.]|nr:TIM-barrel domain-containing protein [Flavisolibacter sp.]
AFFGLLSSHSRVHGFPPREPWEFSEDFQKSFRKITELRYQLMPYVYTQAAICSQKGLPMLKALLLNYPDDPTAWMIEDQYLFGNDLLVAPLMEANTTERQVYLPEGKWVDYQTTVVYEGGRWHKMASSVLPGIVLARWGAMIPHIALAQSTAFMDWSKIEWVAYSDGQVPAKGNYYVAEEDKVYGFEAALFGKSWELISQGQHSEELNFSVRSVFDGSF